MARQDLQGVLSVLRLPIHRALRAGALAAAISLFVPLAGAAGGAIERPRATLEGIPISLADVHRHHCHDGAYPAIRCFSDDGRRDRDATEVATERTASWSAWLVATATASSSYYVVWYEHINYGGASYMTSLSHSDLTTIGWNDAISSFKSVNGQRPKWYEAAGYAGNTWQWSAGAWVSYVGDGANDRFSAVRNVP